MASKSFQGAQIPIRNEGNEQCPVHRSPVVFSCTDCGGELVCMECITSSHQRHAFDQLADVAAAERMAIKTFVQRAESTDLPRLDTTIASVGEQINHNTEHFKRIAEDIKSQGNDMKILTDKITNERIKSCKDSERKNYDILLQRSKELLSVRNHLTKRIECCKEAIQSDNDVHVIDTARDVKSKKPVRPLPLLPLDLVTFTPSKIHEQEIANLFGSTSIVEGQFQGFLTNEGDSARHQSAANIGNIKTQVNGSQVVTTFLHKSFIVSVQKASPELFWVSSNRDDYTCLVDTKGKVQSTVNFESNVQDISVSPKTADLWACCYNNNVYVNYASTCTKAQKPIKKLSTDSPISIVMTSQDTAVVGSVNNVSLLSTSGKTLHTVQNDMVVWPHHIAVCPRTGDIAICDGDLSEWGGNNKPHVIVFDKSLHFRYRYFGPFKSREETKKSEFDPLDVEYDDKGRLLVADHSMSCVRRIHNDGEISCVIHTDKDKPKALTLLDEGRLCLGFDGKVMKIIQY